jgi:hypothetical protein
LNNMDYSFCLSLKTAYDIWVKFFDTKIF